MSRSGYDEDCDDQWATIRWRGAVNSAIKGKRGQGFLREMLQALDALPEKKLIAHDLERDGAVCALGAVGKVRGLDMSRLDPNNTEGVAGAFGISDALAREIVYENDEATYCSETPEHRFWRIRNWIESLIRSDVNPTKQESAR